MTISVKDAAGTTQTLGVNTVDVIPTVTASAYTAGNVVGGIITFTSILPANLLSGVLQSIKLVFKGSAQTAEFDVAIFKASPSNGTYTDKTAPTWNASDAANLIGIYALGTPYSTLGTMTAYNLDGIGKAVLGASANLYAVITTKGTPTPASTTDLTISLGVLQG